MRFEAVEHGTKYQIALLRSLEWLYDHNVRIGASIPLALYEIGMHGPGTVVGIDACPAIEPDDGSGRRVVTATMKHQAANILDLQIDGEDEPIGCSMVTKSAHPCSKPPLERFHIREPSPDLPPQSNSPAVRHAG